MTNENTETTGAVECAAVAILEAYADPDWSGVDLARAALTAALADEDTSRSPDEDLAPGSLARDLWVTSLTDGACGLSVRDARALAAAVRVHLLGGAA